MGQLASNWVKNATLLGQVSETCIESRRDEKIIVIIVVTKLWLAVFVLVFFVGRLALSLLAIAFLFRFGFLSVILAVFAPFEVLLVPHLVHRFPVRRRRISEGVCRASLFSTCVLVANPRKTRPASKIRFPPPKNWDLSTKSSGCSRNIEPWTFPTPNLHIQRTQMGPLVLVEV